MNNDIAIRPFEDGDEFEVSELICDTLKVSNKNDYSLEFIQESINSHSPNIIAEQVKNAHFYVVCDCNKIIGCGGITGYWGSITESYLISIFVLPEYQGMGIVRKIMEILESDEFFERAWRTEVGSSITAIEFYRKLGYEYKDGITVPDEYNVVRLEKKKMQDFDIMVKGKTKDR